MQNEALHESRDCSAYGLCAACRWLTASLVMRTHEAYQEGSNVVSALQQSCSRVQAVPCWTNPPQVMPLPGTISNSHTYVCAALLLCLPPGAPNIRLLLCTIHYAGVAAAVKSLGGLYAWAVHCWTCSPCIICSLLSSSDIVGPMCWQSQLQAV